jgi:TldD protein
VKDRLLEALGKATADYADVRFESEDATDIVARGKELDSVSSRKASGGIVRACVAGGWGFARFDSLETLDRQVLEACRCAALVGNGKTRLADAGAPADARKPAQMKRDWRGVSLDEKLRLVLHYNELLLGTDTAVETSRVGLGETFRWVHFASTRGNYFFEERPRLNMFFFATARDGSLVQNAYESVASANDFDVVMGREELVRSVASRAAALLKAPPAQAGKGTVVLDQRLGGVFVHEAFGHLSEADFLYENPKMRDLMSIGRPMGVKQLNVVDDGSLDVLMGTNAFDDEGTPTRKNYLIKDGVLAGHLHSLETAGKMGERPTGNARAIGRGFEPIVRMTNTYIEGGDVPFEKLIGGIDDGIYACGMLGGQTQMEMFTFSAAYGYRIQGGQVGELMRDVVLTGNVFETLNRIDGFGDDFKMIQAGGGCGKGGQSPLPVTFGAPHLRLRDVVVGGK